MAQTVDQRELLNAYGTGNLIAGEQIVRAHQNEMLRTAFLLAGTGEAATLLARDAFLSFFQKLLRGNAPDDPRFGLLDDLGQNFLAGQTGEDEDGARDSGQIIGALAYESGGETQRYRVEDERSRVLTMLELLDRPTRLALVLREFNALEEEPVCRVLNEVPFTLREWLHPARARILDAAGAVGDESVRALLVNAATLAPRPNLWPEIVGPLEALHAEEEERRQRYTYAAAAAVGLLLIVAGLWVFDVFPFGGGNSNVAAVATLGPTATPTATPEPTIVPTPVPELSSFAIPQGDVPGQLLMSIFGSQDGQDKREAGFYDLETGAFTPYGLDWYGIPSPDGRFLIALVTPTDGIDDVSLPTLFALDSSTGEMLWETGLGDGIYTFAVTRDRVYAITRIAVDDDETPVLLEFDLETGARISEHPDIVASILADITDFIQVEIWASPDNERLFIALEELGSGPTTMLSRTLASYRLPDLTFESSSIQTDSTSVRQFPVDFDFNNAHVTPDGAYLYSVNRDAVLFRSSDLSEDRDVPIPFTARAPETQNDSLRWITSNDGRYLYVIDGNRAEVAIVDLLARRVIRSFPLDFPEDGPVERTSVVNGFFPNTLGAGMTLSPDGRYLYLGGAVELDEESRQGLESIIWIIDLTTWTVVEGIEINGRILHVAHLDDRLVVNAFQQQTSSPDPTSSDEFVGQLLIFDPVTGELLEEQGVEQLPEWVEGFIAESLSETYRAVYARAPAVDHVGTSDVETESTLPRVTIAAEDAVPAGSAVDLAVRALNPADGQLMPDPLPKVRFDPGSTVIVRLSHEDGAADDVILIANPTEPGLYRASTTLLQTGFWSAEVTITGTDGQSWTIDAPRAFEIVPSWEATNGKRYILRVETDPAEPPLDEVVAVIARFVEVESGDPLPESVTLREDIGDELRAVFTSGASGATTTTLQINDEGSYQGTVSFWSTGPWEITVEIPTEEGGRVRVGAGTVNVTR